MKVLILNSDYPIFVNWLLKENPGFENWTYDEQVSARVDSLGGVANFYSYNLNKLGYEAKEIWVNNEIMQKRWMETYGDISKLSDINGKKPSNLNRLINKSKRVISGLIKPQKAYPFNSNKMFYQILYDQITDYCPDVIINQTINFIDPLFFKSIKDKIKLLIAQHAATNLPESNSWNIYDVVISSYSPTLEWFKNIGVNTEYVKLAFENMVLKRLKTPSNNFDVTFVGSFYDIHSSRIELLEYLCKKFDNLRIWSHQIDNIALNSPIREHYVGEAWGYDMYQILYESKMTLNHHGDIGNYANNLRLYEATGVGTLLITDYKKNLNDLFEVGSEILAYKDHDECSDLIGYYLSNENERKEIAKNGQSKTLTEYGFSNRAKEYSNIIESYIN